jgi:hypothetical protein
MLLLFGAKGAHAHFMAKQIPKILFRHYTGDSQKHLLLRAHENNGRNPKDLVFFLKLNAGQALGGQLFLPMNIDFYYLGVSPEGPGYGRIINHFVHHFAPFAVLLIEEQHLDIARCAEDRRRFHNQKEEARNRKEYFFHMSIKVAKDVPGQFMGKKPFSVPFGTISLFWCAL